MTDIDVARTLLADDGVVALDDIRSTHTPDMAAVAWRAVAGGLRPFAVTLQKLYARWADPTALRNAVLGWIAFRKHEMQDIGGVDVVRLRAASARAARWVQPALVPVAFRALSRLRGAERGQRR